MKNLIVFTVVLLSSVLSHATPYQCGIDVRYSHSSVTPLITLSDVKVIATNDQDAVNGCKRILYYNLDLFCMRHQYRINSLFVGISLQNLNTGQSVIGTFSNNAASCTGSRILHANILNPSFQAQ